MILRTADNRHGKRIHLTLTATGEAVLAGSWPQRLDQVVAASDVDAQGFAEDLRCVLSLLQRLNGRQAFGQCLRCAHFIAEVDGYRCGLTGEALALEQTVKICREWAPGRTAGGSPTLPGTGG